MSTSAEQTAEPLAPRRAAGRSARGTVSPFSWSVRRELWENQSIWRAPAIMTGVVLLALLIAVSQGAHTVLEGPNFRFDNTLSIPPFVPYVIALGVILATGFVISLFYCLGALHGERRDRSILFWKSLPVSDLTTVLAKLTVPMVVIPLISFALVVAAHAIMTAYGTAAAMSSGRDPTALWREVPLLRVWFMLLYAVVVLSLWHAPVWGWLLLVSGWARRTPILWAIGAPLALELFEGVGFGTHRLATVVNDRVLGGLGAAFSLPKGATTLELSYMTPLRFLGDPGLWLGLLAAAIFIAAAIWVRRRAEPI